VLYEILRSGGFTTGGFNFDTKLRRQSLDREDLFHAHIGGIDTLARSLLAAERLLIDGALERVRTERYEAWNDTFGSSILTGDYDLARLADEAIGRGLDPQPVSGRQEFLENEVNRAIWATD